MEVMTYKLQKYWEVMNVVHGREVMHNLPTFSNQIWRLSTVNLPIKIIQLQRLTWKIWTMQHDNLPTFQIQLQMLSTMHHVNLPIFSENIRENDPSTQIHYSKCGPFWSNLSSILGEKQVNLQSILSEFHSKIAQF